MNRPNGKPLLAVLAAAVGLVAAACHRDMLMGDPVLGTVQNVAEGGCLSQCQPGWRCNSRSATCEREAADAAVFPMPVP